MFVFVTLACSDSTVGTRAEPPSASILAPADGSSVLEGRETLFEGRVSDTLSDADSLTIAWSSSLDGTLETASPLLGVTSFGTSGLAVGEHTIELAVADEDGASATDSITLTVFDDTPPSITIDEPGAGPYVAGTLITLLAQVDDGEDPLETLRVDWTVQGQTEALVTDLAPTSSGEALASTTLSTGTWSLVATVTDSLGQTALDTVAVTVEEPAAPNTPPLATLDALGGTPSAGDLVLLEGAVSDAEDPPAALTTTWSSDLDGLLGTVLPNAEGAVSGNVVLGAGTHNLTLTVLDTGGLSDSDTATLHVNGPPSLGGVSIAPDPADELSTLQASYASSADPEADPILVAWQWFVNGAQVTGATTDTLDGNDFNHFDAVHVVATPSDPLASGASVPSNTITVDNLPPGAPVLDALPSSPEPGDDLVCSIASIATDADGDALTYTLSWSEAGGSVGGTATGDATTTATVAASLTLDGDVWTCTAVADDGFDTGPPALTTVSVVAPSNGLCPAGFSLAFDITDDATNQMLGGCDWLWNNLFSLGDTISLQWWATDGTTDGVAVWDLSAEITSIQANYASCGSSGGSNYSLGSEDGLWYMTLVQYNDLLTITAWGDDPSNGTDYYYGRISAGYSSNDEIYAVGFQTWSDAWNNRYEDGDRFVACYAP